MFLVLSIQMGIKYNSAVLCGMLESIHSPFFFLNQQWKSRSQILKTTKKQLIRIFSTRRKRKIFWEKFNPSIIEGRHDIPSAQYRMFTRFLTRRREYFDETVRGISKLRYVFFEKKENQEKFTLDFSLWNIPSYSIKGNDRFKVSGVLLPDQMRGEVARFDPEIIKLEIIAKRDYWIGEELLVFYLLVLYHLFLYCPSLVLKAKTWLKHGVSGNCLLSKCLWLFFII